MADQPSGSESQACEPSVGSDANTGPVAETVRQPTQRGLLDPHAPLSQARIEEQASSSSSLTQPAGTGAELAPRPDPASSDSSYESAAESVEEADLAAFSGDDESIPPLHVVDVMDGVLDAYQSRPSANHAAMVAYLNKGRDSPPPSEEEFHEYKRRICTAVNDATARLRGSELFKAYTDGYYAVYDEEFTSFPEGVGFNNRRLTPRPWFVEGLQRTEFDPFPIQDIEGATLVLGDPYSAVLPHLAGEWLEHSKLSKDEQSMRSAYHGASLVYMRNEALAYLGTPDPPRHAFVITFITDCQGIYIFSHHARRSGPDGEVQYHRSLLASTQMLKTYDKFVRGRKHLRNAQDWAKEQSYLLRDRLLNHWKEHSGPHPVPGQVPLDLPDEEGAARDEHVSPHGSWWREEYLDDDDEYV